MNIIGFLIGAIAIYIFMVYFFDWKTTRNVAGSIRTAPFIISIVWFMVGLIVRACKWTYILRIKQHLSWWHGFQTIMISNMVNFIFPVRLGELFKVYCVNKLAKISYQTSVSGTLTDRFSQLLLMTMFLLLTPIAGFAFPQWAIKYGVFVICIVLTAAVLYIIGPNCLDKVMAGVEKLASFLRIGQHRGGEYFGRKVLSIYKRND